MHQIARRRFICLTALPQQQAKAFQSGIARSCQNNADLLIDGSGKLTAKLELSGRFYIYMFIRAYASKPGHADRKRWRDYSTNAKGYMFYETKYEILPAIASARGSYGDYTGAYSDAELSSSNGGTLIAQAKRKVLVSGRQAPSGSLRSAKTGLLSSRAASIPKFSQTTAGCLRRAI